MQLQLPPAPTLPAMAKANPPPAATIGVLGIPEIMRASTAGQQVERVIGQRREKLNEDAQKEQMVWREMQQSLANDRGKLNAEQIRTREKELQDRITNAQRTFRDRNRVIQEAGQYGLAQIERMLVQVIRQVADSRGMNLVLHRAQVALNVNEFDITDQVAEQLNKVLPSVALPADGVEPPMAAATRPGAGGATGGSDLRRQRRQAGLRRRRLLLLLPPREALPRRAGSGLSSPRVRELPPGPGDSRFFARTGPHGLQAVAEAAGAEPPPGSLELRGVAPLQTAGPDEVSFLDNRRYADLLAATRAGAVIVHPELAGRVPEGSVALVTPTPYVGWARVAALFFPPAPARPGVHERACVDPAAEIDPSAEVGPLAVIGEGAVVGPRSRIGPGAVIGPGVVIGADCRIGALASVSHAVLGDRVNLLPGARVGQEGFGFAQTERGFLTVPQLGRVILEDDVEVGANSTIDRGSTQDTVIGAGLAPRQPGDDRPQRPARPLLRGRGAGRHLGVDGAGGLRRGGGASGAGRALADRQGRADRGAGRGDGGRAGGGRRGRQPGRAGARLLPRGGHVAQAGAPAQEWRH